MNLIQRVHDFLAAHGISPKVADPLIAALVAVAVNLILTGDLPDLSGVKTAIVGVLYVLVGVAAPPAASGTKQNRVA